MDDPASACATAGIARNGGATITSRSRASSAATGSIKALSPAIRFRPSAGFRFIFQLAANSFLRIEGLHGGIGHWRQLGRNDYLSTGLWQKRAAKKSLIVSTSADSHMGSML